MKKIKTPKAIDEMWQEHLSGRDTPTEDELYKWVLEDFHVEYEGAEKTNFQMYKEIKPLHENNSELDFETINKVFNLEERTKLDLENLREFIVIATLISGQDVLRAQLAKDSEKEKDEIKKHENRCHLMTVLLQAIESVVVTLD